MVDFYSPALKQHIQTYVVPFCPDPTIREGLAVFTSTDILPLLFNISFTTNALPSVAMNTAASMLGEALLKSDLARRWLLPDPEDISKVNPIGESLPAEAWVDKGLNDEQRVS